MRCIAHKTIYTTFSISILLLIIFYISFCSHKICCTNKFLIFNWIPRLGFCWIGQSIHDNHNNTIRNYLQLHEISIIFILYLMFSFYRYFNIIIIPINSIIKLYTCSNIWHLSNSNITISPCIDMGNYLV